MEISIIEYSILLECSDFLMESQGIPMYKYLPESYKNQDKVKIRLKSQSEDYHNHMDNSLNFKNFNNRSLTCYTGADTPQDGYAPYFIFIPDGYKYIYTKDNMDIDLKLLFSELSDKLESGADTFEELLKYSYNLTNLHSGLTNNDKIIFYNIPYYYCIKATLPYEEILEFYGNIQD